MCTIVLITKYYFNIIRSNSICLSLLLHCMKVKCEIILQDVSVQHDDHIGMYWLIPVLMLYRYWLSSQPYYKSRLCCHLIILVRIHWTLSGQCSVTIDRQGVSLQAFFLNSCFSDPTVKRLWWGTMHVVVFHYILYWHWGTLTHPYEKSTSPFAGRMF